MKSLKLVLSLFGLALQFGFGFNAKATHLNGIEISYKYLSTDNYEVTVKTYRDCSGLPQCAACSQPGGQGTCSVQVDLFGAELPQGIAHNLPAQSCNKQSFGSYPLQWVRQESGYDVLQLCELAKSICNNCNTRTAGTFAPGIEIYTFRGNVNLSSIPSSCCWVGIGFTNCCRNNANETFQNPASLNYYSEAIINRCTPGGNSSVVLKNKPNFLIGYHSSSSNIKQLNLGAFDPDGDSIAYRLAPSLTAHGIATPYYAPYSANAPFKYLGFPAISPPLIPPSGISINPLTGDIRFNNIAPFVASFVIEILEYRTINNTPTLVGLTRKDHQIYSTQNSPNNPPQLKAYKQNTLVPNTQDAFYQNINSSFCLQLAAPDNAEAWDTSDIKLLFTNADTSLYPFTISRAYSLNTRGVNGPKYDSMVFCWNTPNQPRTGNQPYLFSFEVRDRACPNNSFYVRTFAVFVVNGGGQGIATINENAAFEIFPNPASASVHISSKNKIPFAEVKLFNSAGALIKVYGLNQTQVEAELKLPTLAKGIYYLKISGEKGDLASVPIMIEP